MTDLGEMLAQVDDLDTVVKAMAKEQVIRETMARTGEDRETVTDLADAMDSMGREAVLSLTDGDPTTLRDAVSRYVDELEKLGTTDALDAAANLTTILNYPWPGEEELIQAHARPSLDLDIRSETYQTEIRIGDHLLMTVDREDNVLPVVAEVAQAVHRAVLARVIPDRDHHVQISSTDRRRLLAWLERGSGSWNTDKPGRLTVDAVEGGGALIRTRPYVWQQLPRTQV